MTADIVYFNISDDVAYENTLLREWGCDDRITLVERGTGDAGGIDDDSFVEACKDAQGVVVEYANVTGRIMDRLPHLKVIGLQSIGTDMVDKSAATRHGIAVTNAPGFCAQEVAATAVGMILDLARKITYYDRDVRRGNWEPLDGPIPHRMQGKTVGLVFFGGIPRRMAPALRALGLEVIAFAPTKTAEYLASFGVRKVDTLEELLKTSDFVSLHTPLVEETRHLISRRELAMMKPEAFLVNTARGEIVDEPALISALREGAIAGAAVDVIEDERTERTALTEFDNVIINPHAAFLSEESFYEARRMALEGMVDVLLGSREPRHLVNGDWAVMTP